MGWAWELWYKFQGLDKFSSPNIKEGNCRCFFCFFEKQAGRSLPKLQSLTTGVRQRERVDVEASSTLFSLQLLFLVSIQRSDSEIGEFQQQKNLLHSGEASGWRFYYQWGYFSLFSLICLSRPCALRVLVITVLSFPCFPNSPLLFLIFPYIFF